VEHGCHLSQVAGKDETFYNINREIASRVTTHVLEADGYPEQLQRLKNMKTDSDTPLLEAFQAQMPCRMEKVNTPALIAAGVNIWLDVCHNEQGLEKVLSQF